MKELMHTLKRLVSKRREISLIEIRKYDNEYEEAMDRLSPPCAVQGRVQSVQSGAYDDYVVVHGFIPFSKIPSV